MAHLVAAPDKFRGTARAVEVADAMADAAHRAGWSVTCVPMSDGGEGLLDALGGRARFARVPGPLGAPVHAEWRIANRRAVIEMARASGLDLVGGPTGNDALAASTNGTGALIAAAVAAGARQVVVGAGGSASTDGGLGALEALRPHSRLAGVQLEVACDVSTRFVDAAEVFAPQKGASPAQVVLLRSRLVGLAERYHHEFGIDVSEIAFAGAAGGLAGGLAAVGARLVSGFDLVAEAVGLAEQIERADLVITGEGLLDDQSFNGKVVGGTMTMAARLGVPVAAIVGDAWEELDPGFPVVSLTQRYGRVRAEREPLALIGEIVDELLGNQALRRR
ncbi:MAG: glycerate kinase [Acidimicrobiales bacterium]